MTVAAACRMPASVPGLAGLPPRFPASCAHPPKMKKAPPASRATPITPFRITFSV